MDINWLDTGLTAAVVFFATVVHGIAGFGLAQVSMGLLPLFRTPEAASVIFSIVAIFSNARVWWSVREEFDWRDWAVPVIGLAFGMPVGIYVFSALSKSQLRIAIGITLLVAVVLLAALRQISAVREWLKNTGFEPGWKTGVSAGFLAGLLGGAVAIPGPPMILYGTFMMTAGFWKSGRMKAVFTAFFGTLMLYRTLSLSVTGTVTSAYLLEAAVALPGMFLGAWIGIMIYDRIPRKIFAWVVLAMLTVNAIVLLLTTSSTA